MSDLLASGMSRHRVAVHEHAPFWGLRADVTAEDIPARARQFLPRLGSAFYSHATAARIWGIPLPPWLEADDRLHVSFARGHRAPAAEGLAGHELAVSADDVTRWSGVPLTTPSRTWRDLCSMLEPRDLVAAGDHILRAALGTPASLAAATATPRFRGRTGARLALPMLDPGAESPPESLLRFALTMAGLPSMVANQSLFDVEGRFVARPDLRFTAYPVVVEYDGDGHRTSDSQWRRDVERFAAIEDLGLDVIRATADDVPFFHGTVSRARRRLVRRGWTGIPSR